MHVGFRFIRQVEVHHQTNVLDIHAAGRDVGRHQHRGQAFFEAVECLFALGLGLVAVNCICLKAGNAKTLGKLVGSVFGATENDGQLLLFSCILPAQ